MCTNNSKQAQIHPHMFNMFKLVHTQLNTPKDASRRPKTPIHALRPDTANHTQSQRNAPRHAQTFPDKLIHSQLRRNTPKHAETRANTPNFAQARRNTFKQAHIKHLLHSMEPQIDQITIGCQISHSNTICVYKYSSNNF
jgi:hypothetical protein